MGLGGRWQIDSGRGIERKELRDGEKRGSWGKRGRERKRER